MGLLDKLNPISIIGDLVGKALDKIAGDKMSDAEKAQVQLVIQEGLRESEDAFRDFVIEHTGAAKDMPRSVQILRGMIRPVVTLWAFGLLNWVLWLAFNADLARLDAATFSVKVVFALNIITLVFWFGDKALQRSGLIEVFKGYVDNRKS